MKTVRVLLFAIALAGCANSLVDDVPRLYACERGEGAEPCPGGWRCGLSGYCVNPEQALPYACETSADCSTTWHCGAERVCYDRATAIDRACRASLESTPDAGDCAPGWRCGREVRGQVCHPIDAGAAYLCTSDSDCEAGWRCGPEDVCVDVAGQGLREGDVAFTTAKVSPLLPGQVDLLQVRVLDGSEVLAFGTHRLVFVADGGLTVATNSAALEWPFTASRETTRLARPARALVETEAHLLVSDATGLVDYRDAFDGGSPALVAPALANADLRYAPPILSFGTVVSQEELASFAGSTVGLCGRGTQLQPCDATTFQLSMLPSTVNDVAFIDEVLQRRSALAATSGGLYFAPRLGAFLDLDGGTTNVPVWRPMALAGLSDACATSPVSVDRLAYDPARHILSATTGQDRTLRVFTRPLTPQNTTACGALEFDPVYGPCAACGQGEVLIKLGTEELSTMSDPTVMALCRRDSGDGGSTTVAYRHRSTDGGCSLAAVPLPLGVSRGYQLQRETFGLTGLDSVGLPRRCPVEGCDTMLFSSAPDRVAGGPALLGVYKNDIYRPDQLPITPPSGLSSPLGLRLAKYSNLYVAGGVPENPDWMISSTGRFGTQGNQSLAVQPMNRKLNTDPFATVEPHALFSRSADLLPSAGSVGDLIDASGTRSLSTIATDAVGQPWLIVGAGDRIWATDARSIGDDGGVRTIGIKVVPLPSADLQSLAFTAHERGDAGTGPLLDGFTVAQQRLFRVVVHSPTLWLSDEIRLPDLTTLPLSVWIEGGRGRVGTSDGRVFGLPVPVALSTTIPEAPLPTVLDYGSLCGKAFALSPTALYRLSLETPPLGEWKRVSLDSAFPGLDAFGPHWGPVMHKSRVGNQEHLVLFSQTGLVVELVATCD